MAQTSTLKSYGSCLINSGALKHKEPYGSVELSYLPKILDNPKSITFTSELSIFE